MARTLDPLQFVLMAKAGWMNQCQQQVIEYLQEEDFRIELRNHLR